MRSNVGVVQHPALAADTLAAQVANIRDADERLDRLDGPVATYVVVAAVAGAVPETVEQVVDALDG